VDSGRNARPGAADGRDRDDSGRARNARPRDATGRPLPRGAAGIERAEEDPPRTAAEALAEAQRLLDADQPFAAHDVLEAMWKQRRDAEHPDAVGWQGLAQLAVGLTHLQRGNTTGAVTLVRRGAENLAGAPAIDGVDTAAVAAHAEQLARDIEAGSPPQRPGIPLTQA
jgi:hypothetical protein